jgi:hypothetical protein
MRARKKGSNYEWEEIKYVQLEGSDILFKEEYLEFEQNPSSSELETYDQVYEERYWQEVRVRAAIAAMQALIRDNYDASNSYLFSPSVAVDAVVYADALVKQLKKKV